MPRLMQCDQIFLKAFDAQKQLYTGYQGSEATGESEFKIKIVLLVIRQQVRNAVNILGAELGTFHQKLVEHVGQPHADQTEREDDHERHRVRVDKLLGEFHVWHTAVHPGQYGLEKVVQKRLVNESAPVQIFAKPATSHFFLGQQGEYVLVVVVLNFAQRIGNNVFFIYITFC